MIKLTQPYPALLVQQKKERTMVVADLHIGWEITLAEEGVYVPSQTPKLLNRITQLIEAYKPHRLLFLGDVKHTIARAKPEEWRDIPSFFESLSKKVNNIEVVAGNHDGNLEPLLPETVKINSSLGVTIGNTGLFHGHAWPPPEVAYCPTLVMGHVHPVVVFRDPTGYRITRQVWVKADCDPTQLRKMLSKQPNSRRLQSEKPESGSHGSRQRKKSCLLIMPSFNDFLGGQPVNRKSKNSRLASFLGPMLRSKIVDMENAEIYLIDGAFLGSVHQLKDLS